MFPDLQGKSVVVTGAGQGIGEAIAKAFLNAGSHVTAVVRGPVEWANTTTTPDLDTITCDVREPSAMARWLDERHALGRPVDILVNNAGELRKGKLIDCSIGDFDELFAVNTRATFEISQLFARHMRTNGGGAIVNAVSYAATLASVSYGLYAASKAATLSLTKAMAAEWAPFGIRVNAFSPGVIPTRMTEPALKNNEAQMLRLISLHRTGTVNEVAAVALFLASNASSYLTGVNIDVTGGKLIVQDPDSAWP